MSWFVGAMLGTNILEGILGANDARDQAKMSMESIDEQISLLNKQREDLTKAYEEKKGIATDRFGLEKNYLRETTGDSLEDLDYKYDVAASKTGLAYSGTVERGREKDTEVLRSGYEFQRENLYDRLGESLLNIDMEQKDRFGQIESQISGLKSQRKLYEEQADSKFLGLF